MPIDPRPWLERCPMRQITSWNAGRRSGDDYRADFARKCFRLRPGETRVLAEPEGAGLFVRFFLALPIRYYPGVLRALVVRMFWDGEEDPSVEVPVGDFFGCPFGRYRPFDGRYLHCLGGGYASSWPMPFERGARIELRNDGPRAALFVFHALNYYEGTPEGPMPLRFHAQWRRERATRPGEPFRVLEAEGEGYLAGLHLQTQNRDPWWLRSPREWLLPGGFGLGHLEGWERVRIDGEEGFHGTGHEELFDMGWYFLGVPALGRDVGCTHRSYLSGRVAAYRFWADAPIPFRRELRFALEHGLKSAVRADYTSVAYWYQSRPRAPFPPLPPFAERKVTSALTGRLVRG